MNKNTRTTFAVIVFLFLISPFLAFLTPADLDYSTVLGEYMRATFLIHSFILIFGFLNLIKPLPERFEEFKLLNSLPIESGRLFIHFLTDDIRRLLWLPFAMMFAYGGLTYVATIRFLLRPMVLVIILFLALLVLHHFLHLIFLNLKWQRNQKSDTTYIEKNNFIISGIVLLLFEFTLPALIPIAKNNNLFLLTLVICGSLSLLFSIISAKLFAVLYNANYWLKSHRLIKSRAADRCALRWFASGFNPLLIKNFIIRARSKTNSAVFLCLITLMTVVYWFALNNPKIEDTASVLLGFNIIYIIIYSFNTIKNRDENWEPAKIIYSLPISAKQFYMAIFLPGLTHCMMVSGILSLFLLLGGGSFGITGGFLLKAVIAVVIFTISSSNHSIVYYPDNKIAQKRFGGWLMALFIVAAAFSPYLNLVLISFTLFSFLHLNRVKLFRVSA